VKFPFEKHTIDFSLNVNSRPVNQLKLTQMSIPSIAKSLSIDIGDNIQWKLVKYRFNPV